MKKLLVAFALAVSFSANAEVPQPAVLASPTGQFVLGAVETGSVGVSNKTLYLLDTKTGRVWYEGCIANGQDGKCARFGLRPMYVSDGAGGLIFENIDEAEKTKAEINAAATSAWGANLKGQKK